MNKISNPYKTKNTGNQARFFWSGFVQWLRLLVLSFKRKKEQPAGIFLHEPDTAVLNKLNLATITTPPIKNQKLPNMTPAKLLIKWGLMLLLAVCVTNAMAQTGPYQFTGNDTVCVNETKEYGVTLNPGSEYDWIITPPPPGYTMTPGATPNLISVTWTIPGSYTMKVIETNADGCV